jgi:hypothetical protein
MLKLELMGTIRVSEKKIIGDMPFFESKKERKISDADLKNFRIMYLRD